MSRDFSNDRFSPFPCIHTRSSRDIRGTAGGQGEVRPEAAFADWSAPSSSQPVTRMEAILDPLPPRLVYSYLSLPFHSFPCLSIPFQNLCAPCVAKQCVPPANPSPPHNRHLCRRESRFRKLQKIHGDNGASGDIDASGTKLLW